MNAQRTNTTVTPWRLVWTRLVVSRALVLRKKSGMETHVLVWAGFSFLAIKLSDKSYGWTRKVGRGLKQFRFVMVTLNCYENQIQRNLDIRISKGNEVGLKDRVVRFEISRLKFIAFDWERRLLVRVIGSSKSRGFEKTAFHLISLRLLKNGASPYFVRTDEQRKLEAPQPDGKRCGGLGGELGMFKGLLDHVTVLHSLASLIVPLSTHK